MEAGFWSSRHRHGAAAAGIAGAITVGIGVVAIGAGVVAIGYGIGKIAGWW